MFSANHSDICGYLIGQGYLVLQGFELFQKVFLLNDIGLYCQFTVGHR